jgi:hypothetical protein
LATIAEQKEAFRDSALSSALSRSAVPAVNEGATWPIGGGAVWLTRMVTALRKSRVRTGRIGDS